MIFIKIKVYLSKTTRIFKSKINSGDITKPALLLLEEDGLSFDRSYRGQPHWLFKEDAVPSFRTLILKTITDDKLHNKSDIQELNKYGVYSIPKYFLYSDSQKHPIKKKISLRKFRGIYI